MELAKIYLNSNKKISEIRSEVGFKFKEYVDFHNHNVGNNSYVYSYPKIQYRGNHILAVGESNIKILGILENVNYKGIEFLNLKRKKFDISVKSGQYFMYAFKTPWIAFNQKNYKKFLQEGELDFNKILIGNILSMCKGLGVTVDREIELEFFCDKVKKIQYKNNNLIGVYGFFSTNVELPIELALGGKTAHGFGQLKEF